MQLHGTEARGTDYDDLGLLTCLLAVRGAPECPAAPGVHLVRGSARFPAEEHGAAGAGDSSHRNRLPCILRHVHRRTSLQVRPDPAETLH